jgi:uncharacterized membrane protein
MSEEIKIQKAELFISHILRWGVIACALIILFGWVIKSNSLINSGILMLICLPIARVFAATLIFFKQKDYIYVGLSTYVLIILITSMLLGKKL